jgi:hypothetical protein
MGSIKTIGLMTEEICDRGILEKAELVWRVLK